MKQNSKLRIIAIMWLVAAFIAAPAGIYARSAPEVHAAAHILLELESGRVISEHQAHTRMFPAATTMVLTAILAYEYIGLDEIVVAGYEITMLPLASARNFHEVGEAIQGINLLRGMLIGAGNDTANIVAMEVARRTQGNDAIGFMWAQQVFAALMTQRASELGALNSNFINAHGYHHDNHFSTAYDMAQIARHAMSIPAIARIAGQEAFSGPMSGGVDDVPEGTLRLSRTWRSPNELLHPDSEFYYPYATGLRTGRTDMSGDSLVAAAERDGIALVSVTFNSPEIEYAPTRWQDNINLFEHGFANFTHRVFLEENTIVGELPIHNPRLGDYGYLEFFSTSLGMMFLSEDELGRLVRHINFADSITTYVEDYGEAFVTPISENSVIGNIVYTLDGEEVFAAPIYAARNVALRTTASDIDHYMTRINEIFFSVSSIPYWVAAISVLILTIVLVRLARNARRRKKNNYKYKWKH